jgi:PIN domain nuclease of toxin-antitoxin system
VAVLDASAVLAFLNEEPGHEIVASYLDGGQISAVNWSEVLQKLLARGRPEHADYLVALGVQVVPFDRDAAVRAASLQTRTRLLGLGIADRACLASGLLLDTPVVTADRVWTEIEELGVELIVIR